jgi:hypothetical protein
MAEQARPSSPLKWILIGCGCMIGVVIVGLAGCGVLGYLAVRAAKQEYEAAAGAGSAFLTADAAVRREFGTVSKAESNFLGSALVNDKAQINFSVETQKGRGTAVVHLVKRGGAWAAVGCSVAVGAASIDVGEKVDIPRTSADWDD